MPTTGPGDARALAAKALADGFQTIIAAGGDGTVNEVVNGMGDVPGGFERARLGVLPLGTINVFARELGIPLGLNQALEVILRGNESRIDLASVDLTVENKTARRYLIQLGGAGLDSRAVELVSWRLKKKTGPLAYVIAGLKAYLEKHPVITITGETSASGELVLLGNGRYYGGSFRFFPNASLGDGILDACVFPKVTLAGVLRVGLGMLTGCPHRFIKSVQIQAREFTLTSPSRVCLEIDGENAGELPARVSVMPKALRVIVSR
jgi:YegS/Rv2252/BmrU family lipid kinase